MKNKRLEIGYLQSGWRGGGARALARVPPPPLDPGLKSISVVVMPDRLLGSVQRGHHQYLTVGHKPRHNIHTYLKRH